MKKKWRRGLVVGKFSPLHRGHQSVIERALDESEEVVLISYSNPEFAGCEATRRSGWLESLYPQTIRLVVTDQLLEPYSGGGPAWSVPHNDAGDLEHRLFVGRLCRDVLRVAVDAVFTSESYGNGFAAELTQFFQSHDASASPVAHVQVDESRSQIPISGTLIRKDVHAHRTWLEPRVYASFVKRVCLLGGESTGKTTLGIALADALGTSFVREYGRDLWVEKNGNLAFEDMIRIGRRQVELECEAMLTASNYLICDTSPLTTAYYSRHLFGRVESALEELARRSYDSWILCAPDFPFFQDGTRVDDAFRMAQDSWYRRELSQHGRDFIEAKGAVPERLTAVLSNLNSRL